MYCYHNRLIEGPPACIQENSWYPHSGHLNYEVHISVMVWTCNTYLESIKTNWVWLLVKRGHNDIWVTIWVNTHTHNASSVTYGIKCSSVCEQLFKAYNYLRILVVWNKFLFP